MVKIKLFGEETEEIIRNLPKLKFKRVSTPKTPTISELKWEISKSRGRLKELEAQDESNFSDIEKTIKGKEVNSMLVNNHIIYYQRQLDELRLPFMPLLNKWKEFILAYSKEKGEEIEIWFDTSAPYDVCVSVRVKSHNCYYYCVSFRFKGEKLLAYDSSFGGGTSFLDFEGSVKSTDEETGLIIKGIMDKVFNKECCKGERLDSSDKRVHKILESGWIDD